MAHTVSTPPQRTRLRGEDRVRAMRSAAKLYEESGSSIRTLAAQFHVSYGGMHRLLTEAIAADLLTSLRTRAGVVSRRSNDR